MGKGEHCFWMKNCICSLDIIFIKGNQKYNPFDYVIEGDYSQVAFWIVAGILGSEIKCLHVKKDSLQGDREIIEIVQRMGANVEIFDDYIIVKPSQTYGTVIDISQCPDIGPILTVLAALSKGETKIINAERLRIKMMTNIVNFCIHHANVIWNDDGENLQHKK